MRHPLACAGIILTGLAAAPASAAPADANVIHLSNVRRTGYTAEALPPPYHVAWVHTALHKPRPAWKEPVWEVQRIDLDYAYPVSAGNGLVYYGSSADHAVHALDAATGKEQWRFITGGPVRLAPAVAGGRLYAASDDGRIYCLDAGSGEVTWTYRPAIPDERLIGNGQMMSRWPARAGVLVRGDRAYTAFGMWSPEGVVLACLDAATGKVLWWNDTAGRRYETHPHYEGMGGVSPNGYLALCGDVLVVPCGRAAPAFFDTRTGEILYHEAEGLFPGGAWTMTFRDLTFTPCEFTKKPNPVRPTGEEADIFPEACLVALRARTGEEVFHLKGMLKGVISDAGHLTCTGPNGLVSVALDDVLAAARAMTEKQVVGSSIGHFVKAADHARWQTKTGRLYTLVQAGDTVIAGGRDVVQCYDAGTGEKTWQARVDGDVHELLPLAGALLASTTEGKIYCFRPGKGGDAPSRATPQKQQLDVPADVAKRAEALVAAAGVREGYGLVLGGVSPEALAALAEASALTLYHPAPAGRGVAAARRELSAAGLYGVRVTVHDVASDPLPYVDWFANAVLAAIDAEETLKRAPAAELYRVLRPYGGMAVVACKDDLRPKVEAWLQAGGVPKAECERVDLGVRVTRGPLQGAGEWTHQYADAGRSCASAETRVRLPLKVLWFGGVGPGTIVSRHYRTPAPLVIGGRVFVPGIDDLSAMDAYNGRILWQRHLPEVGHWPAAHRGGTVVADREAVYAAQGMTCLRLDPATGETMRTYKAPPAPKRTKASEARKPKGKNGQAAGNGPLAWEYLAVTDGLLVGTVGDPNVQRSWWSQAHPANHLLFAMDKATGKVRWTYEPKASIDSSAIAVAGGRVFLIDGRPKFHFLRVTRKATQQIGTPPETRTLKALDLATGRPRWQTNGVGPYQNNLWVADGVVVVTITPDGTTPFRHKRSGGKGPEGTVASAFNAEDGTLLWKENRVARCSPVITEGVLYTPIAYDLRTGKPVDRPDPLTGRPVQFEAWAALGCGKYAGCPTLLTVRSGSMGFYDLHRRSGLYQYPETRASCWINMVPAGGMVVVPEGSSSCPCAYSYKTSLALVSDDRHNHWGVYGRPPQAQREKTLRRLRLNLAAPGDRPDADGHLWFAWPRPHSDGPRGAAGMGIPLNTKLPVEVLDPAGNRPRTVAVNPDWTEVAGTDAPWLYTYGWEGVRRMRIRLAPGLAEPKTYCVTLHFAEMAAPPAPRVFDVKVNGKTVIAGLNVLEEAGGPRRALAKTVTVTAPGMLTLEFAAKATGGPEPILCGLEIVAQGK